MKKALFMLLLFLGNMSVAIAQNVQEVVHLKNGSVVRGIVIEQTLGISLKVQTSDGSIFAYPMSEVEKITKESIKSSARKSNHISSNNNSGNNTGYKGFIDAGYTIGMRNFGTDRAELSTSHGYQFNPYIYTGAGIGIHYYIDSEVWALPIFGHIRANILDKKTSPYIEFKIGYSITEDVKGLYISPSIGCKINSLNVSVGYIMQKAKYDYDEYSYEDYYYHEYNYKGSLNIEGFSLKIGWEF